MIKSFKNSKILRFCRTHARLLIAMSHQCCWMQYSSSRCLLNNIICFYGSLWRRTMNDFKTLESLDQSKCSIAYLKSETAPNYVDLAPPYAGLLHGLCDTLQSCAGFIIPVWSNSSNFGHRAQVNNLDNDGSSHKWKFNNDQRMVTILVHYCTDANIFIVGITAILSNLLFRKSRFFKKMTVFVSVCFCRNNGCWSISLPNFCFC